MPAGLSGAMSLMIATQPPKTDELDEVGALVKPEELEELEEKPEELEKLEDEEGEDVIEDWNGTTLELLSLTSNVAQIASTSSVPARKTARPFVHVNR